MLNKVIYAACRYSALVLLVFYSSLFSQNALALVSEYKASGIDARSIVINTDGSVLEVSYDFVKTGASIACSIHNVVGTTCDALVDKVVTDVGVSGIELFVVVVNKICSKLGKDCKESIVKKLVDEMWGQTIAGNVLASKFGFVIGVAIDAFAGWYKDELLLAGTPLPDQCVVFSLFSDKNVKCAWLMWWEIKQLGVAIDALAGCKVVTGNPAAQYACYQLAGAAGEAGVMIDALKSTYTAFTEATQAQLRADLSAILVNTMQTAYTDRKRYCRAGDNGKDQVLKEFQAIVARNREEATEIISKAVFWGANLDFALSEQLEPIANIVNKWMLTRDDYCNNARPAKMAALIETYSQSCREDDYKRAIDYAKGHYFSRPGGVSSPARSLGVAATRCRRT